MFFSSYKKNNNKGNDDEFEYRERFYDKDGVSYGHSYDGSDGPVYNSVGEQIGYCRCNKYYDMNGHYLYERFE